MKQSEKLDKILEHTARLDERTVQMQKDMAAMVAHDDSQDTKINKLEKKFTFLNGVWAAIVAIVGVVVGIIKLK